jgi:hypothetical protein
MKRFVLLFAVLAMIAAACSGEATDSSSDDPPDGDTPSDETPAPVDGDIESSTFDDPRGPLFSEFQASIDRNHPFNTLDEFCLSHDPAENREATDPGITADSIEIHHIRQQLETLAEIGFGVPVGDPRLMFEVLVDVINEQCGGIRGRTLDLGLSEFGPLSPTVRDDQTATCIEATEDRNAVVVLNSTGFQGAALLCIAEEHETAMITTQGVPDDFTEASDGRLLTLDESITESLSTMATVADDMGLLDDTTIGVVYQDTPGQPEAVQAGLLDTLSDLGYTVAVEAEIGCGGTTSCADGLENAVTDMRGAGVDAVFPMMAVTNMPGLITEMLSQGFAPGDVQFFNSKQNSQDGDLVSSKVVAFGGEDAGNMYNGAVIFTSASPNDNGLDGEVSPFQQMCIDTYAANGGTAQADMEGSEDGMLATVCGQIRVMARAIYDAGENPTRADIYAALGDIGGFDSVNMIPMAWNEGDPSAAQVVQTLTWTFPCEMPEFAFDENDTCMIPNFDYIKAFD